MSTQSMLNRIMSGSLVLQIAIGIAAGVALSLIAPEAAKSSMLLGNLFVQALKAVAPVLVLVLVASAIANRRASHTAQLRPIVMMYLVGTFSAALLAVTVSTLFPTTLVLQVSDVSISAPQGIAEVLGGLLQKLVDNPINAVLTGNYIGILVWGVLLGVFLHKAAESHATIACRYSGCGDAYRTHRNSFGANRHFWPGRRQPRGIRTVGARKLRAHTYGACSAVC